MAVFFKYYNEMKNKKLTMVKTEYLIKTIAIGQRKRLFYLRCFILISKSKLCLLQYRRDTDKTEKTKGGHEGG